MLCSVCIRKMTTILKNIHTVYKLHVVCSVGDDASAFAYVLVRSVTAR